MGEGYDVTVVTKVSRHGEAIRSAGIDLVNVDFQRSARHPLKDLILCVNLIKLYRTIKPDLVHHVSLKPVLSGSIAAAMTKVPIVINALTGLGYLFSSNEKKAIIIRSLIKPFLSLFLNRRNSWTIFQNSNDQELLSSQGIKTGHAVLIRGSGVDVRQFTPAAEPEGDIMVILAARMLKDKGVYEFVKAAQICQGQGLKATFVLVGDVDRENPMSVSPAQLKEWQTGGVVEWWGHREDMADVLRQAHIICLPSYREGLPKILLEAAAAGRPIIAGDVPGCTEIVIDGVNGLLVPVRNAEKLAAALKRLIESRELRETMGKRGRALVEKEFSVEMVNARILALYRDAIQHHGNNEVEFNA